MSGWVKLEWRSVTNLTLMRGSGCIIGILNFFRHLAFSRSLSLFPSVGRTGLMLLYLAHSFPFLICNIKAWFQRLSPKFCFKRFTQVLCSVFPNLACDVCAILVVLLYKFQYNVLHIDVCLSVFLCSQIVHVQEVVDYICFCHDQWPGPRGIL